MSNLYEALEACLKDIELGADIESSLLRYPDIADELRPVLETSVYAKSLAVSLPSEDMMRRNRLRLLQRAAEMRTTRLKSASTPGWLIFFRRAAIALAVLVFVFLSGTGLVRASSTTLPGDNLYPVKRTYEDLALLFTIDSVQRDSLEVEYENERLDELHELIALGRAAQVDFAGIVTEQNGNRWVVAGVPVILSSQTDLQDGSVAVGDAVRVFGITQSDYSVLAERIDQLPQGANLPDAGKDSGKESEGESNSGSGSGNSGSSDVNDSSGPGNGNDNSNENNSGPGGGDNGNDNNSGPGGGNDNSNDINSVPGGGGDTTNNSGSESGNENGSNSGSGSIQDQSNDNGSEDNSGSGGGGDNNNENNSGSGGGGDDE